MQYSCTASRSNTSAGKIGRGEGVTTDVDDVDNVDNEDVEVDVDVDSIEDDDDDVLNAEIRMNRAIGSVNTSSTSSCS